MNTTTPSDANVNPTMRSDLSVGSHIEPKTTTQPTDVNDKLSVVSDVSSDFDALISKEGDNIIGDYIKSKLQDLGTALLSGLKTAGSLGRSAALTSLGLLAGGTGIALLPLTLPAAGIGAGLGALVGRLINIPTVGPNEEITSRNLASSGAKMGAKLGGAATTLPLILAKACLIEAGKGEAVKAAKALPGRISKEVKNQTGRISDAIKQVPGKISGMIQNELANVQKQLDEAKNKLDSKLSLSEKSINNIEEAKVKLDKLFGKRLPDWSNEKNIAKMKLGEVLANLPEGVKEKEVTQAVFFLKFLQKELKTKDKLFDECKELGAEIKILQDAKSEFTKVGKALDEVRELPGRLSTSIKTETTRISHAFREKLEELKGALNKLGDSTIIKNRIADRKTAEAASIKIIEEKKKELSELFGLDVDDKKSPTKWDANRIRNMDSLEVAHAKTPSVDGKPQLQLEHKAFDLLEDLKKEVDNLEALQNEIDVLTRSESIVNPKQTVEKQLEAGLKEVDTKRKKIFGFMQESAREVTRMRGELNELFGQGSPIDWKKADGESLKKMDPFTVARDHIKKDADYNYKVGRTTTLITQLQKEVANLEKLNSEYQGLLHSSETIKTMLGKKEAPPPG